MISLCIKVTPRLKKSTSGASADETNCRPKGAANEAAGLLRNKYVLIADDVEANRIVLEDLLRECGLSKVAHAVNGRQAFSYCQEMAFDYIFMDTQMPDIDGLKATEQIRQLGGRYERIPIVAVTAVSRIVNQELCVKSGATAYIEKPVDAKSVQELLVRLNS